jgi:hypothetical protein
MAQMLLSYELGPKPDYENPKAIVPPQVADHFNALGQPGTNGIPDLLTKHVGDLIGCSSCIRRLTSFIIRSPMIAIMQAGVCHRKIRLITAGARAARASFILPMASRRV